jgi:hypothetical protein
MMGSSKGARGRMGFKPKLIWASACGVKTTSMVWYNRRRGNASIEGQENQGSNEWLNPASRIDHQGSTTKDASIQQVIDDEFEYEFGSLELDLSSSNFIFASSDVSLQIFPVSS